jgi:hypothetical protein
MKNELFKFGCRAVTLRIADRPATIRKPFAVSTKPLARRTLRVMSLRCWSANELAHCCDTSYHLIAACQWLHLLRRKGEI